jgi:hypothetical protein
MDTKRKKTSNKLQMTQGQANPYVRHTEITVLHHQLSLTLNNKRTKYWMETLNVRHHKNMNKKHAAHNNWKRFSAFCK